MIFFLNTAQTDCFHTHSCQNELYVYIPISSKLQFNIRVNLNEVTVLSLKLTSLPVA